MSVYFQPFIGSRSFRHASVAYPTLVSSNSLEKCPATIIWLGQDRLEVGGASSESRWDRVNLKDVDEVLDVVVAPGTAFL
jgi:hypothetical protein